LTAPQLIPLLERERELDALAEALDLAKVGTGRAVIVEGPAGIGKSMLLAAARRQAEDRALEVLQARGSELDRDLPFGVAVDLFARVLASAAGPERRRLLSGQAGLAQPLLEPHERSSNELQAVVRALYWLTANLTRTTGSRGPRRALAIVVDDAQWCDSPSLRFLIHLAARIDELPLALVLAVRTGESGPSDELLVALRHASGHRTLVPAPLSEAGVGELVEAELPGAEPAFVAACARASGGNPFIARELSRTLREEGIAPTSDRAGEVENLVPATVLHAVLSRLGRLGDPAQRLAAAVAVLGDGAALRHAIRLAELSRSDAESAADALMEAGILQLSGLLAFVHPLIATAVYSDLPVFARARAHRRAADLLAADGAPVHALAAHLRLSTPDADARTVELLREAARRDIAQGHPEAAVRLLERALVEPPSAPDRAAVLLELAEAETMNGDRAAREHALQALELLTEPEARISALRVLSRIRLATGEHEAAAEGLQEILDGPRPRGQAAERILGEYVMLCRTTASLHREVTRRLDPISDMAQRGEPPTDPMLLAHVVFELALRGEPGQTVLELASRATRDDPLIDAGSHGMPMGIIVQGLCIIDEEDAAERIADAALAAARARGAFFAASTASYHRAIPRYYRGALADALADLDQALAPAHEGWTTGQSWPQSLLVHCRLERGEVEAAAHTLGTIVMRPDSMDEPIVRFARARVAMARRDPETALTDATAAGRILAGDFAIDRPAFVPWRRTAALAAAAVGQPDRARALAAEQLELARSFAVPRGVAIALRTAAAVGEESSRITLLSEAAEVIGPSQSSLERAHVLTELGAALRRAGQRADAQRPLRRALQAADAAGAAPLAEAARDELRATGARPRRAAFTGADSLTPAELRVARLAAQGLSNAQIAQDLFVTLKTVQTHLARTYRKLDITSRRELERALGADR
jgi:DNA-binding CsgD family transcriptional regulator